MNTKDYWKLFTNDQSPADFVWQYGRGDSIVAVEAFLQSYPNFMGIMRTGSWKETFASEEPLHRDTLRFALRFFLEERRSDWESKIEEYRYLEKQKTAETKAQQDARALAEALTRIEEDAHKSLETGVATITDLETPERLSEYTESTDAMSDSEVSPEDDYSPDLYPNAPDETAGI
jgi:hypothetical protein